MEALVQVLLTALVRLGIVSSEALIHIAARVHFRGDIPERYRRTHPDQANAYVVRNLRTDEAEIYLRESSYADALERALRKRRYEVIPLTEEELKAIYDDGWCERCHSTGGCMCAVVYSPSEYEIRFGEPHPNPERYQKMHAAFAGTDAAPRRLHVDRSLLGLQISELVAMLDEFDAPGDHLLRGLANMLYDAEIRIREHGHVLIEENHVHPKEKTR